MFEMVLKLEHRQISRRKTIFLVQENLWNSYNHSAQFFKSLERYEAGQNAIADNIVKFFKNDILIPKR